MEICANPRSHIVIVDDNWDNLRLVCGMLKKQHYSVRPVPNGSLAVEAVESQPPDAILMDVNMPGMDGYETCRKIKKSDALHHIPVIFLTGLCETVDKVRGFAAGGVDYVTKPFKFDELGARIETHIKTRREQEELQQRCDKLTELEKLRDELTHMVIHDLLNPLAVISGVIDFALSSPNAHLDDTTTSFLKKAQYQSDLLNQMINSLLDTGRLEESKMPLRPVVSGIPPILNEVRGNVRSDGVAE